MTVYAITDTKKGEQGLRLLIFKLGPEQPEQLLVTPSYSNFHMHDRSLLDNWSAERALTLVSSADTFPTHGGRVSYRGTAFPRQKRKGNGVPPCSPTI